MIKNRFPLYYLTWNTTHKCNLKCEHCYNEFFAKDAVSEELSTKEGIDMIRQAVQLGLRAILFTGGESLLRSDLLEIVRAAKAKNLLIFLATNGTLIDEDFIKNFKGLVDKINISLDGGSAEKHDKIRSVKGSFNKALKSIKKLKKHFNVSIAFTAHSNNLDELPSVARIAKENDVSLTIKRYIPVGRGANNNLTLSSLDYKILVDEANGLKKVQKVSFSDPFPASSDKKLDLYGGCLAGIHSLSVDFNGDICICTKLKLLLGNIKTDPLRKIWDNSKILKQLRNRELKGKCKNCDRILSCGGCRAAAYAETGDFLSADPLCFYSKAKVATKS